MYFWLRSKLVASDAWLRFLGNGRIPHRGKRLLGYWKLLWLKRISPRHTKPVGLAGYQVSYASLEQLAALYKEIFIERLYAVDSAVSAPTIIDAGANIGIATLYFKAQFPSAKIVCFEPDPRNFELLKKNIEDNGLANVEAHQVALSDKPGTARLYYNRLLKGDNAQSLSQEFRAGVKDVHEIESIDVRVARLSGYYPKRLDILKMDIEGAEGRVLSNIRNKLRATSCILMEYHYDRENTRLDDVLRLLEKAGHQYALSSARPLQNENGSVGWIYSTRRTIPARKKIIPMRMREPE